MDEGLENPTAPKRRRRIVEGLDRMIDTGQVTETEAARLRAADGPSAFDSAIRDIRVRHAGPRLDAAADDGLMTAAEADAYRERLQNGEHSRSLRTHLRRLLPAARNHDRDRHLPDEPE